jgi:thiol-disulfide isomerase/thioredoxin
MHRSQFLLVAGLAALAGCQHSTAPTPSTGAAPAAATAAPSVAPSPAVANVSLQILDYAGIQRLVASHHGQVIVMDGWSTGCPPCIKDFPQLVALSHKFRPDVACISLSFDYEGVGKPEDRKPQVLAFLQKQGATFDNILAAEDADTLYKKLDIVSVPVVLIYDGQGKLREKLVEPASESGTPLYQQVDAAVKKLLAEH